MAATGEVTGREPGGGGARASKQPDMKLALAVAESAGGSEQLDMKWCRQRGGKWPDARDPLTAGPPAAAGCAG